MSNPVFLRKLLDDALEAQRLLDGLHEAWEDHNRDDHRYTPDEFVMLIQSELSRHAIERVARLQRSSTPRKALAAEHAQQMRAAVEQASDARLIATWRQLLASCSKDGIPFHLVACACGYDLSRTRITREEMVACIGAVERWFIKGSLNTA